MTDADDVERTIMTLEGRLERGQIVAVLEGLQNLAPELEQRDRNGFDGIRIPHILQDAPTTQLLVSQFLAELRRAAAHPLSPSEDALRAAVRHAKAVAAIRKDQLLDDETGATAAIIATMPRTGGRIAEHGLSEPVRRQWYAKYQRWQTATLTRHLGILAHRAHAYPDRARQCADHMALIHLVLQDREF